MMSSVVGYSRLRFSLFSPVSRGSRAPRALLLHSCAPWPRAQPPSPPALSPPLDGASVFFFPPFFPPSRDLQTLASREDEPSDITYRGHARFCLHVGPRCRYIPVMQMKQPGLDLLGNLAARERRPLRLSPHPPLILVSLLSSSFVPSCSSPSSSTYHPSSHPPPPPPPDLSSALLLFRGRRHGYSCLRLLRSRQSAAALVLRAAIRMFSYMSLSLFPRSPPSVFSFSPFSSAPPPPPPLPPRRRHMELLVAVKTVRRSSSIARSPANYLRRRCLFADALASL